MRMNAGANDPDLSDRGTSQFSCFEQCLREHETQARRTPGQPNAKRKRTFTPVTAAREAPAGCLASLVPAGCIGHASEMKPSSALIIGGAYLSYTIASWSPERREAVVEMIRDGVGGAINAFLEDPLGCLRRFWDEKKRSPMLLLALASKLMADNLRRKRLKREAAAEAAPAAAKPAPGRKKRK